MIRTKIVSSGYDVSKADFFNIVYNAASKFRGHANLATLPYSQLKRLAEHLLKGEAIDRQPQLTVPEQEHLCSDS